MFDVFISYAHEDERLASALASGLGRIGKPWWRRRSMRVFRDANVMTASSDLWDSIRGPLEDSRWFVAVISPASASSPWVAREMAWWVQNRGSDQLLVVLADGTCEWDTAADDWAADATAVPAPLRGAFDSEPRWVDATWTRGQPQLQRRDGRLVDLLAEIAAPVQGTTKDAIVGEELRQHRRTVRTAVGAASVLFLLTIAAAIGALVALDQRDKAESRRQQAFSQSLAGQAAEVGSRRPDLGIRLAVEAWRHAHTSQAEQALISAAQNTLPAAQRFRAPDNGPWVFELVAVPEHGYALAGRLDGSLTLWKLPSAGHDQAVPETIDSPHRASIAALTRDASGQRIVSIDVSGGVAVWDAASLARPERFTVPVNTGELVADADLTADGRLLMVSTQSAVQLWDVERKVQVASSPLVVSDATVTHAAMSSDATHVGATIRATDGTSAIEIWNLNDGSANRYPLPAPNLFVDAAFTNDGLYFGVLDALGGSAAYRVADGVVSAYLTPENGITTLTGGALGGIVPASSDLFISANGSANALVWSAATNRTVGTYPLVLGGSPSAITTSENAIVASDVAGTMTWVPFGVASSASLAVPAGQIPAGSRFGVSAVPSTLLTVVGSDVTVWDTRAKHAVGSFTASRADQAVPIFTALDRTARRVALGYADGTLELRDAATGKVTVEKPHLVTGNAQVSFAGDSVVVSTDPTADPAELLVVSREGAVRRLWRAPAHRRIYAFATSGESVAVGLDDGRLLVWDTVRSDRHRELNLGAVAAWRIAFGGSGERLVVGDGGGRLHVVDRTGVQLRQLRDPITTDHGPVLQIGFSGDDRVVAVSPIYVAYADIATGNMLASNITPTQWSSLVTVPGGFMTVDAAGALMRWRLDPHSLLSKLCPELKTEAPSPELRSYLDGGTASTTCPAAS